MLVQPHKSPLLSVCTSPVLLLVIAGYNGRMTSMVAPDKASALHTWEDLARVPGKAELIGGRIVEMPPTGCAPGFAATQVVVSLTLHCRQNQYGVALSDGVGFRVQLPGRESFSPDASLYVGKPSGMKFLDGAPIFALEVRSQSDVASDYGAKAEADMAAKRADYFAAGTQVVWDVDLLSHDVVRVYRASDPLHPKRYSHGEQAEAEPAVPGWTFLVDDLYSAWLAGPEE
jgi:Uma2 family endonuclease